MSEKVRKELEKNNSVFVVRAIAFALLLISPMVYVFVTYQCWDFTQKISFSGWGILGIFLGVVGIWAFFKYLLFGGKWAYWKQVVQGVIKVLVPFVLIIALLWVSMHFLKELLGVLILSGLCFFGAYLVNPFPEWAYKQSLGETSDIVAYALKKTKK